MNLENIKKIAMEYDYFVTLEEKKLMKETSKSVKLYGQPVQPSESSCIEYPYIELRVSPDKHEIQVLNMRGYYASTDEQNLQKMVVLKNEKNPTETIEAFLFKVINEFRKELQKEMEDRIHITP